MTRTHLLAALVIALSVLGPIVQAGPGATQTSRPTVAPEAVAPWAGAECLFTGKLKSVSAGPVGRSMPPVYTHRLTFTLQKVLRGKVDGPKIVCSHVIRQVRPPEFPEGKMCVVAAASGRRGMKVLLVQEQTPENIAAAEVAASLPLGWYFNDGKLLSPWAGLKAKAWNPDAGGLDANATCARTGRPALLAGKGIALTAESVAPAKSIRWTNPDGDGEYKITIENRTDKTIVVPALLSQGEKILWEESLVIVCQGKSYPCPGSMGVRRTVGSTKLAPGQSVSTVVNTLRLDGPKWPRGGYRIEFQFCLGEASQTKSFYYMSRHHDGIREALKKR